MGAKPKFPIADAWGRYRRWSRDRRRAAISGRIASHPDLDLPL